MIIDQNILQDELDTNNIKIETLEQMQLLESTLTKLQ